MLEIFKMAMANRDESLKDIPLTTIMEKAAREAGWHQVLVPNLTNRNKLQTRYTKAFGSAATAELICRTRQTILSALRKRDINPQTIDSHIGWGVFSFIKTYNPEKHNTDAIITSCIYRAVLTRVQQSLRKEEFKYRPGYQGITEKERLAAEKEGRAPKGRYTNTPKEISFNSKAYNGDDDSDVELGDTIPAQGDFARDIDQTIDLVSNYGETPNQKILVKILIDLGGNGKVSRNELAIQALKDKEFLHNLKIELTSKGKNPEKQDYIDYTARQIKIFYRNLKKKLVKDF